MLMKKRGHTCLIASSMASLAVLMLVLYGTIGTQQPGSSGLRYDYQLLGRPLYKLDLSWPRNPELFTGEVTMFPRCCCSPHMEISSCPGTQPPWKCLMGYF